MPKQKLFGVGVTRRVNWQAIDAQEEAEGEVERVQHLAAITRCQFVDGRVTDRLICPDCATEIDLAQYFRSKLIRV